jgi:hypothetical protein
VECNIYGRFRDSYSHKWRNGRWQMYEEDLRECPDGREALTKFLKIRESRERYLALKRLIKAEQPTT